MLAPEVPLYVVQLALDGASDLLCFRRFSCSTFTVLVGFGRPIGSMRLVEVDCSAVDYFKW